jgi:nicotinamidase-related amidase
LPVDQLDLVPSLARIAGQAKLVDKPFYSAFMDSGLHEWLGSKSVTTLVVTGAETDVCVLSTVLTAVDLGYRIILVEDALCSSSDDGHDALMTMYRMRLGLQIELTTSDQLASLW